MQQSARSLFLFMIVLCLCSPFTAQQSGTDTKSQEADVSSAIQKPANNCSLVDRDYEVFTAVLHALPEDPNIEWKSSVVLLVNGTESIEMENDPRGNWGFKSKSKAAPSADTIADYEAKNRDTCPLNAGWGDNRLYRLISLIEIDGYFHYGAIEGWERFYKAHPHSGGYWTFSRPAYNKLGNEALLYIAHHCGWICGTYHLYLLTKQEGQWRVKNRKFLGVS